MRFQAFAPPPTFVGEAAQVAPCIRHCLSSKMLGTDTETLGLLKDEEGNKYRNMTDQVVVLSLSPDENTRYMVPRKFLHHFREVIESDVPKALTNVKFDAHRLLNSGGGLLGGLWADTVHMDFMLDDDTRENHHGLKDCMKDYFGYPMMEYKQLFGKIDSREITPGHDLWNKWLDYASLDAWATRKLAIYQLEKLSQMPIWEDDDGSPSFKDMYWDTEAQQLKALFHMERRGMKLDVEKMNDTKAKIEARLQELAFDINKIVGYPINPNSTQQLAKYFFEEKGYEPLGYTPTGRPQVNEALYEHLAFGKAQDPVAKLCNEYKKDSGTLGTRIEGYLSRLAADGRLHTNYNTTLVTGRLSSTDPNLQNVKRVDEDPWRIRDNFIPEPGNRLIIGDYSQLEMRILAEACGDPQMISAIKGGLDMHSFTASKVLGMEYDVFNTAKKNKEVWAVNARTAFKKTGFGIVYGITKVTLSQQLSEELGRYVSQDEAQKYINQYLDTFPNVKLYMRDRQAMAKQLGYVQTIAGRRRRLSKARNGRGAERGHAERQAINAPIQGSAADIVKRAMIFIDADEYLRSLGWFLIHQVHDELILEGPAETADEANEIVREYMENPFRDPLSVPLIAEPKVANNWGEK